MTTKNEDICEFPFIIPADWFERMKCPSQRRFVAFYWSEQSDGIVWNDGEAEGINGHLAVKSWILYMRHREIETFLLKERVNLGYCNAPATHWLICDTKHRKAYVVPINFVGQILKSQRIKNVKVGVRYASGAFGNNGHRQNQVIFN